MRRTARAPILAVPVKHDGETMIVVLTCGEESLRLKIPCVPPETADLVMEYPLPFPFAETVVEAPEAFFAAAEWRGKPAVLPDVRREPLRQQFHFTPARGWMNDPNGLYWHDGTWHLFFQHNPLATYWNNMHWSHAESADLAHWRETGIALYPDALGTMYSGSAWVDAANAAGFGRSAVLLFYTNAHYGGGATQNLAYSTDGGKTFRKYSGNPLIPCLSGGCDRDPLVVFDPEAGVYRMALYYGDDPKGCRFALFASDDLLHWRHTCDYAIPGGRECPGLARMRDRATGEILWVFSEANMLYRTGTISPDGKVAFRSAPRRFFFGDAYAGQRFAHAPDGRTVFIAWLRTGGGAGGTYAGSMTLPLELELVNGVLHCRPAADAPFRTMLLTGKTVFRTPLASAEFDLRAKVLRFHGVEQTLPPELGSEAEVRLAADRLSLEIFDTEARFAAALYLPGAEQVRIETE